MCCTARSSYLKKYWKRRRRSERERDRKQKRQGAGLRASRIRSHLRGPDLYRNPCPRTAVPTPGKRTLREQSTRPVPHWRSFSQIPSRSVPRGPRGWKQRISSLRTRGSRAARLYPANIAKAHFSRGAFLRTPIFPTAERRRSCSKTTGGAFGSSARSSRPTG